MPFSVHTDARYTFVNARMAPVLCLLVAVFLATLPLERLFAGVLAITCIVLTAYSVSLHDRVSREIESFIPIFDKMKSGAAILPLVRTSPSAHLDPFFYANFHYNFPFYYHVLKEGGTNPDMFNTKLMPIGYRPGNQPARPPQREPERWTEQRAGYDYVLTLGMSRLVHRQLDYHGVLLDSVGPWRVYKLK
jgi:hypothetical protein